MREWSLIAAAVVLVGAAPPPPSERLREIVARVSGARMKATVEKLVSFGTRHTLSSQTDPKRGIGASLKWTEDELDIEIRDDGRGSGSDASLSTGNGLLGLTERVVLVGGAFETHPRPSGGYQVHAILPLSAPDLTEAATLAS